MNPETAEQKKWYLLGIVHQLVSDYAKENKLEYYSARKDIVEHFIAELESKKKG